MTHPTHWTRPQPAKDLTGQKHGLLTVLRQAPSDGTGSRWKVVCECGSERTIRRGELLKNISTHRGCRKESA